MNIADAVERLSTNDLNPHVFSARGDERIIGLIDPEWLDDGTIAIAEQYAIYFRNNYWNGIIPSMPETIISRSKDLAEVVDAVCQFYDLRNSTISDGMEVEDAAGYLTDAELTVELSGTPPDTIWGEFQTKIHTPEGHTAEGFGITRHAGTWLSMLFCTDRKWRVIAYSMALGEVTYAVKDLYDQSRHSPKGEIT